MKKYILFTFVFLLSGLYLKAQELKNLGTIEMEELEDYEENEPTALACADYILSNEVDVNDYTTKSCLRFMMRWMEGTDISFELGPDFVQFTDGSNERMTVYIASLVKAALDNPDEKLEAHQITLEANEIYLDYCESHRIKLNKKTRKALKARKK